MLYISDTDPDPAFQVNPDPDPIRIHGFDDQKIKKKYSCKFFYIFFLIKNGKFIFGQATWEAFSPQKRTPTPSTSKIKFMNIFLCLWVIFALLDPDYESRDPIESPSNPDPDTD